jgi:hypothetical protein
VPTTTAAKRHTVKQGEHLSHIAALYGFSDYKAIWDYGENAELRKKRKDPHVLAPGDVVSVPAPRQKTVAKSAGALHRFRLAPTIMKLRLRLLDPFMRPIKDAPCWVRIDDTDDAGQPKAPIAVLIVSDKDGRIEHPITRTTMEAEVEVQPSGDTEPVKRERAKFDLFIGGLEPVTENNGLRARLNNLGYFAGLTEGIEDKEQLRWAIEEFQFDNGIKPQNGDLDDPNNKKVKATLQKLVEVHGDKEPV